MTRAPTPAEKARAQFCYWLRLDVPAHLSIACRIALVSDKRGWGDRPAWRQPQRDVVDAMVR